MDQNSKWMRWFIFILGLCLLIVMGATMGGRSKMTALEKILGNAIVPIYKVTTSLGNGISQKVEPLLHVWNIKEENQLLRAENESLKEELMDATLDSKALSELRNLKKALKYVNRQQTKNYISCNVIAKDTGNWYNMFVVDVGLKDGVKKNATVINGDGLIGIVYEAGDNWSKVISIIDNNSTVGFEMKRIDKPADGLITGSVNAVIEGKLFDPKAVVNVGEEIITSGVGIYPKGIRIGKIKEVLMDKNSLLIKIIVTPSVDFRRLDKVLIIPQEKETFYKREKMGGRP